MAAPSPLQNSPVSFSLFFFLFREGFFSNEEEKFFFLLDSDGRIEITWLFLYEIQLLSIIGLFWDLYLRVGVVLSGGG